MAFLKRKIMMLSAVSAAVALCYLSTPWLKRTWRIAHPKTNILPLPDTLIALQSAAGQRLLAESQSRADYGSLSKAFEAQIYLSYCGVATGVIAKNALNPSGTVSQADWFDGRPKGTRTRYDTFYGGMTLADFTELVRSHHLKAQASHGGTVSESSFRERLRTNMANADDVMVINYHRKGVSQKGGGHFSPLAAYHAGTDRVLIMDVAAHKYPPVWAKVTEVWRALDTVDSDSQKTRGFVEITR